jgi:hypothetical protein
VVRSGAGPRDFLFVTVSRQTLKLTQPPIKWVPGALSLGVKRQVREANNSHSSGAGVTNEQSDASLSAGKNLPSTSSCPSTHLTDALSTYLFILALFNGAVK